MLKLQKEKPIIILPTEKGKATVIMETAEYQEKNTKLLSDKATYETLKKDPTKKYKNELTNQNAKYTGEGEKDHRRPVLVLISNPRKSTTDVWLLEDPQRRCPC